MAEPAIVDLSRVFVRAEPDRGHLEFSSVGSCRVDHLSCGPGYVSDGGAVFFQLFSSDTKGSH
jgi:hypothetical protein